MNEWSVITRHQKKKQNRQAGRCVSSTCALCIRIHTSPHELFSSRKMQLYLPTLWCFMPLRAYLSLKTYFVTTTLAERDRDVPSLYPTSCDVAARTLPPRLLAPPPAPVPAHHEAPSKPQDNIKIELENASLWKQFSAIGTEMIITKKGR